MLNITVAFDSATRLLSVTSGGDYIGSTRDNLSSKITVTGLDGFRGYDVFLVFGNPSYTDRTATFIRREIIDGEIVITNDILTTATDGVLSVSLRLTKGDEVINSYNVLDFVTYDTGNAETINLDLIGAW